MIMKKTATKKKENANNQDAIDKEYEELLQPSKPILSFKTLDRATKLALSNHIVKAIRKSFELRVKSEFLQKVDRRETDIYSTDEIKFSYDCSVNGVALFALVDSIKKGEL
jgi:hypothetical protein